MIGPTPVRPFMSFPNMRMLSSIRMPSKLRKVVQDMEAYGRPSNTWNIFRTNLYTNLYFELRSTTLEYRQNPYLSL